ncbi:MAG: hypothetical protein DWQ05_09755 [Calditrichaeota bacterium]|nr:MAG: hypothetical protein DWQ05_09755 [Calditrichota bacterium]
MPLEKNTQITTQLNQIFAAHQVVLHHAEKSELKIPLIFAGMAVYLCSNPDDFRPNCDKLSGDIDYVISKKDIPVWQEILQIEFSHEQNVNFNGLVAKTRINGIEMDFLADAVIKKVVNDGGLSCRFFYDELQPFTSPWQASSFYHIDPAILLYFKLLLGRGRDEGKFDFEDAAALILGAEIDAQHFFKVIFEKNKFSVRKAEIIASRLQRCVEINKKTSGFRKRYLRIADESDKCKQ